MKFSLQVVSCFGFLCATSMFSVSLWWYSPKLIGLLISLFVFDYIPGSSADGP